jgi:hypothetical protein
MAETDKEPLTSSQAQYLAEYELGDFKFLSSSIIWYEIYSAINMLASNFSQRICLLILLLSLYKRQNSLFTKSRETGFSRITRSYKENCNGNGYFSTVQH